MKIILPYLLWLILGWSIEIPVHAETTTNTNRLVMGFYAPSILDGANRTDVEISFSFWAQELARQQKNLTSASARLFDTIASMQEAFTRGELDMIIAPPMDIARYFKREDLADGFIGVGAGKKTNALIILTRTDKQIESIDDLKGKRLLIPENDELADIFLETLSLKHFKKHYPQIFKTIQVQKRINHMIFDVFFNKAEVAVVYESAYQIMQELNPQLTAQTKILSRFPVLSRNYSFFHRNYSFIKELTETAISQNYAQNPRLKQILEVFHTQEIDYCRVSELEPFDKLYQDYLTLKKDASVAMK